MPSDLKLGINDNTSIVIDSFGIGFPFSRGIMASSVLATGIETPRAYVIAQLIQDHLSQHNIKKILAKDLTDLAYEILNKEVGDEIADYYRSWQKIKNSGRPIVIALSAASGIGKSTFATRLSLRLGINRVVTTDSIREVLRTVIPDTVLPELHVSTFETVSNLKNEGQLLTFQRQSHAVEAASAAVSKRYIVEKKHLIIEGVHLLPGELAPQLSALNDKPIVVELLLSLSDEQRHRDQLIHRSTSELNRDGSRNIKNFDKIRAIQDYLKSLALKNNIPNFDLANQEDLTQRVIKLIIEKNNEE
jgi:2-phosphoglycerate kinase